MWVVMLWTSCLLNVFISQTFRHIWPLWPKVIWFCGIWSGLSGICAVKTRKNTRQLWTCNFSTRSVESMISTLNHLRLRDLIISNEVFSQGVSSSQSNVFIEFTRRHCLELHPPFIPRPLLSVPYVLMTHIIVFPSSRRFESTQEVLSNSWISPRSMCDTWGITEGMSWVIMLWTSCLLNVLIFEHFRHVWPFWPKWTSLCGVWSGLSGICVVKTSKNTKLTCTCNFSTRSVNHMIWPLQLLTPRGLIISIDHSPQGLNSSSSNIFIKITRRLPTNLHPPFTSRPLLSAPYAQMTPIIAFPLLRRFESTQEVPSNSSIRPRSMCDTWGVTRGSTWVIMSWISCLLNVLISRTSHHVWPFWPKWAWLCGVWSGLSGICAVKSRKNTKQTWTCNFSTRSMNRMIWPLQLLTHRDLIISIDPSPQGVSASQPNIFVEITRRLPTNFHPPFTPRPLLFTPYALTTPTITFPLSRRFKSTQEVRSNSSISPRSMCHTWYNPEGSTWVFMLRTSCLLNVLISQTFHHTWPLWPKWTSFSRVWSVMSEIYVVKTSKNTRQLWPIPKCW